MAKEPGIADVFMPPAELVGGDPSVAEAALQATESLSAEAEEPSSSADRATAAPAPKGKAKDRRGLASPKHSKRQLRDNVRQLLDEKAALEARVQESSGVAAADLAPAVLEQAEQEASAGVKFFATEIFELLVKVRGKHWQQSEEKLTRIGKAWGKPLAPHWEKGNPWVMAALSTAVIVAPSIYAEVDLAQKKKEGA